MSTIPSNLSRVPNLLISQVNLSNLNRSNLDLFKVQNQMATGREINRFSDDSVRAATVSVLDDQIERGQQVLRNLGRAEASLNQLDSALGEGSSLVLDAKTIASSEVGTGTSAAQRASQAQVVTSMIQSLYNLANRASGAGHMFAGSRTGTPPIEQFLGGYRYVGEGDGLTTDLGLGSTVRVTLGASNSIGAVSGRIRGDVDLDPALTGDTRLADLGGARSLGVTLGTVRFSVGGGDLTELDLTGSDTVQDVADSIAASLRDYETATGAAVLGAGGVSFADGAFTIDVNPASGGLAFTDVTGGVTAQDLGLAGTPPVVFASGTTSGLDTRPKLTWRTPVSALGGVTGALGSIRVNNAGQSRVVDLSAATTLEDIKNAIEGAALGVRVEINEDGTGIDVLNEVAAGSDEAMSIAEIAGNGLTATRLGIRSYTDTTRLADFNDGRGVEIVGGTGDPALDADFAVTLGDTAGTTFTVDLRPQDVLTVGTVIARINEEAAAAGLSTTQFRAELSDGANGIALVQGAGSTGPIGVSTRNNSKALEQLGLRDGAYDATSRTFRAEDRATVRVDNLFTHLIDLRDALLNDDTFGITIAGEKMESSADRLAQTRALVGGYAGRVDGEKRLQEDRAVADEKTRSDLRDVDYTEAASRFSLLQTQLQAGLQSIASSSRLSLLDYLG